MWCLGEKKRERKRKKNWRVAEGGVKSVNVLWALTKDSYVREDADVALGS